MAGLAAVLAGWWRALVGAAVVAAPCFLLGHCAGANAVRHQAEAAQAVAVAAAQAANLAAHDTAAVTRRADDARIAQMTKDLTDAIAAVPDSAPDAVSVAHGCERLRQSGQDVSGFPACAGPGG